MEPILNIENLTKVYGNTQSKTKALNGITFQVMPGEFLGIMGSSGSGKSTLLNCIATVIQPSGGSISIQGKSLAKLSGKELAAYRGKTVGYLFQNFELLDNRPPVKTSCSPPPCMAYLKRKVSGVWISLPIIWKSPMFWTNFPHRCPVVSASV